MNTGERGGRGEEMELVGGGKAERMKRNARGNFLHPTPTFYFCFLQWITLIQMSSELIPFT